MRARVSRQRDRIRAKKKVGFAYRVIVALAGTAIVVTGVVLLPLPGPGWLIIFFGLGILASEFAWARALLDFARTQVARWTAWVRQQSVAVRSALGVASVALAVAAGYGYVAWRGVPDWVPGVG